jgi:penicillin-binding protein 1C
MLAFDKGYIAPKTVVADVPVNFSGYRPENYDQSYRGKVSVEQALALSLNVPAVNLLDMTGLHHMNDLLERGEF